MAHSKSTKKRIRQNARIRLRNKAFRSRLRNTIKQFDKASQENDIETCRTILPVALKVLDKSVTRGLIHKNNAARQKSRLSRRMNALAGE